MEKLRLHLDDLAVQSFATAIHPGGTGTVHGRINTAALDCYGTYDCGTYDTGCENTGSGLNTCAGSCPGLCASDRCGGGSGFDASACCLSAGCGGSGNCPTGGYCNSFYVSGCR
jgi:hypothetical protein